MWLDSKINHRVAVSHKENANHPRYEMLLISFYPWKGKFTFIVNTGYFDESLVKPVLSPEFRIKARKMIQDLLMAGEILKVKVIPSFLRLMAFPYSYHILFFPQGL